MWSAVVFLRFFLFVSFLHPCQLIIQYSQKSQWQSLGGTFDWESLSTYSHDQFSHLIHSGTCLQSFFLEIGPFTRQLNRLICWSGDHDLKIQTRSLELSTLAGWLGMAANGIHLAYSRRPIEKAQGHKARLANFTPTFTTSNHTNLALLPCSCGILRTRTSKRMGQQLQLLWELKQKKLVPV